MTLTDDDAGTVTLAQYALPPLQSGSYQIAVQQQVSAAQPLETFTSTTTLTVAGPRSQLPPGVINSVFPPPTTQGEFDGVLAHVVFNNATLPWQRSPYQADPPQPPAAIPPWVAVLTFDANDPPPVPVTGSIADLTTAPSGIFLPTYTPEAGEQPTDPVTYVDIPAALFNAITPSLADLGWLGHLRQVDPANKPQNAQAPAPDASGQANYAVVFGNRLPVAGNTTTAMLVALENFSEYLPTDTGPSADFDALSPAPNAVRVIVLSSWSFSALPQTQDFAGLLGALDIAPSGVQLPFDDTATLAGTPAGALVASSFAMGYTALAHSLVDGSKTVSWYRGPFLPYGTMPAFLAPPYVSPDQLMRFDPNSGMFDASYAAAWQLGQLLALQSGTFSAALYRWKLASTAAAISAMELSLIDQQLPAAAAASVQDEVAAPRRARISAILRHVVAPAASRLNQPQDRV